VDLDSLLGRHAGLGGEVGGAEPLGAEACRRLACDGAVTRVLVTRRPTLSHSHHDSPSYGPSHGYGTHDSHSHGNGHGNHDCDGYGDSHGPSTRDRYSQGNGNGDGGGGDGRLADRLRAAVALLPPALGGAPTQPLEVGRTSRVVQAAQRAALVVRDGGCVFPGCERPQAWCEAHHLRHWLHGGPTDLANLALLCRAHHRAVHEGGWRLVRQPDGQLTATPPHRHRSAAA
jgi:hypothetical protein